MTEEVRPDEAEADEAGAAERYRRHQELVELVADAARRADALQRLDLSLVYGQVLPNHQSSPSAARRLRLPQPPAPPEGLEPES